MNYKICETHIYELPSQSTSQKTMTTLALKKLLVNKIAEINDVTFLNALKTIIDTKTQILSLTIQQKQEIIESQKEIKLGIFIERGELDKEFNTWLSKK